MSRTECKAKAECTYSGEESGVIPLIESSLGTETQHQLIHFHICGVLLGIYNNICQCLLSVNKLSINVQNKSKIWLWG